MIYHNFLSYIKISGDELVGEGGKSICEWLSALSKLKTKKSQHLSHLPVDLFYWFWDKIQSLHICMCPRHLHLMRRKHLTAIVRMWLER